MQKLIFAALLVLTTTTAQSVGSGTGFFVSTTGHILTNAHVIDESERIMVLTKDGLTLNADVLTVDSKNDLALIKVQVHSNPLHIRSTDGLDKGTKVFTVGFPSPDLQGMEAKYTDGVISSFSGRKDVPNVMQITVPIQPGNSGGPLLDDKGNVVGIVVSKLIAFTHGDFKPENVGYAIKGDYAIPLLSIIPSGQRGARRTIVSVRDVEASTVMIITLTKEEVKEKNKSEGSLPASSQVQAPPSKPVSCAGSYMVTTWTNCVGTLTRADRSVYVGSFKAGTFDGHGSLKLINGDSYAGEFALGKYEGQGTLIYADGKKYVGRFERGEFHGEATLTFPSGTKYVGYFKNGNYYGKGFYSISNGETYEGDFINGKYEGFGVQIFPDKKKYIGAFKDDKWFGLGTLTLPSGESYVGAFVNGKFNGQGTYITSTGVKIIGEFRDDQSEGVGKLIMPNGLQYEGLFKNNRLIGKATVTWPKDGIALSDVPNFRLASQSTPTVKSLNSSPSTLAKPIRSNGDHRAREFNDKSLASAKNSDWTQAIRLASAAIDIDPGYAPAYVNRCWAYMAKGYNSEAAADCNIALSIDPNNTEAINNRGAIRQAEGDLKSALADFDYACKASLDIACTNFEKIEGYSPKDVSSFVNKQLMHSLMKFQEKDWGAVIAITTKILEIAPKTIDALATRSGAFANKGLLDEALSDAQSAVRLNPEYALSYNNRGYVYQLMGKPRLAAIDYEISCGLKFDLGCINFDKLQKQIQ